MNRHQENNTIVNNEVNKIAECNLPHDIINPPKPTKNLNRHYSTILHGCMNTQKGRAKFKNFRILLDSGHSSTIVIRSIIKIYSKYYTVIQCHTQADGITTNLRVKIDFCLA